MLFEVPGLKLGEPKVEEKEKSKRNPPEHRKKLPKQQNNFASKDDLKVQKNSSTNKHSKSFPSEKPRKAPSASSPSPVRAPTPPNSLSIFKSEHKTKLQRKMEEKLMGARFRYLNQKLYESDSKDALLHFKENPEDFKKYHEGFKSQVAHWPVNPIDLLIEGLKRDLSSIKTTWQVADMGCGEAKIMAHFENNKRIKIISFDLAAARPGVIVADMTKVPLPGKSVDVVIFCLSLMNTNFLDALREARRILKEDGGILRIAEVESRFESGPKSFVSAVESLGFKQTSMDMSHRVFWLFEFKTAPVVNQGSESELNDKPILKPCLYKKR